AQSGETRVLAACAPRTLIEAVVKAATDLGLPLRGLGAAPLAYAAFLSPAVAPQPGIEPLWPAGLGSSMVVDVGAETTDAVVIRDGKAEMARTIPRGGRRVTEAIMAAFRLDEQRAEQAKLESAFLAHRGTGQMTASQAHMDA